MTVLTFPSVDIASFSFGLRTNTQQFISPLSGTTQTQALPGSAWAATYTLVAKKRADMAEIQAFLAALQGPAGRFYARVEGSKDLLGTGAGTPMVNGADQTGRALETDGWDASQTVLKAGDYFQVSNELKMMTADAVSDGSGNATLNFSPPLRARFADNTPIVVSSPTCIMRLVDDGQMQWTTNASGFQDLTFSAVESFYE